MDGYSARNGLLMVSSLSLSLSFARFYLESKFCNNLSENRILEMLKGMKTHILLSSLNLWMHQIMEMLRERLEPLMLEAIRHLSLPTMMPFGQPNRHAQYSHREMFQTYRYGKTQLASGRKSLLSPEFGVYVRVVGKLQIEQSQFR